VQLSDKCNKEVMQFNIDRDTDIAKNIPLGEANAAAGMHILATGLAACSCCSCLAATPKGACNDKWLIVPAEMAVQFQSLPCD